MPGVAVVQPRQTIDEMLLEARSLLARLEPREALAAAERGALIVDIREDTSRHRDGVVPGSLHLPRTVLEWRADPASRWHNPHVGGLGRHLVLLCDHGCSSSLAAVSLVRLGFTRATDVIGGFAAWREAGLPVAPAGPPPAPGTLPGMGAPEP